jgi:hypothetical protein
MLQLNQFDSNNIILFLINDTARIRHQCRKTTVLKCHKCLINTGAEKNQQHLNKDKNFGH